MKESRIVVLSALSTAFATIFLVVGSYLPDLSLATAFTASISMMPILIKGSYKGGILTYISTVLLAGIFSGFFTRWDALFPFISFMGLHPLVNAYFKKKKVNKIIGLIIKDVWFVLALTLMHFITKLYIGNNEFINTYIYPILIIGGAIIFPLYDYMMDWFYKTLENIMKRLKL